MAVQSNDLWYLLYLIFFPMFALYLMSRNNCSWYKFEFEIFNRFLIDVLSWKIFSSKHEISLLFWINWTKTYSVYKDLLLFRTLMDEIWISIVWFKYNLSIWYPNDVIIQRCVTSILNFFENTFAFDFKKFNHMNSKS